MILLVILGLGCHSVSPENLTHEFRELSRDFTQAEYRHSGIEPPLFVFKRTDLGDFSGNEHLSNSPRGGHPTLTASGAFENRGYALLMHE